MSFGNKNIKDVFEKAELKAICASNSPVVAVNNRTTQDAMVQKLKEKNKEKVKDLTVKQIK